jgi:molecular chaperone GrpE
MNERLSEHEGTGREDGGEHRGPTIRDRRRIDPETYQVREPQETAAPAGSGPPATTDDQKASEVTELRDQLAERTSDLQRLQAEYVNYKRRVDRDRDLSRSLGIEGVLKDLLPVLDDLRSAREHGELTGAFKAVGDEVERITSKYGLVSFGEKGDPFNPHIHEALLHAHATGITGPTCVEILQPGYKVGDRVLRPARVAVAEPEMAPEPVVGPEIAPEAVEGPEIAPEPVEGPADDASTSSAGSPVEGQDEGLRQAQPAEADAAERDE